MNLARIQALSLATKGITTLLGLVQSGIVVWLLTAEQFGLIGLVMSIGGVVGVSQHLGILDGTIREIAVLKKRREIGKVFWVSHLVRQAVTVPVSVALLLLAGWVAGSIYGRPTIAIWLQVTAGWLVLQGLQDVLGGTLTGMKKFTALYVGQIITAVVNVLAFGLLTWRFGMTGFFAALVVTTSIMVLLYGAWVFKYLRGYLRWPSVKDIRQYGKRVLRVSGYMYVARVLFIVWQRLPVLVLGGVLLDTQLGWLNAGLAFGSRLTIIGMALSEVNLAWMSSLYVHKKDEWRQIAERNMQKVLVLLMGITLFILFFGPDILGLIRAEYLPARGLIIVMTLAFFLYALIDIGTSSVFVPADRPRTRMGIYALMTGSTAVVIGWLLMVKPDPLLAAYGVLIGALLAYVMMVWLVKRQYSISLLTKQLIIWLVVLGAGSGWLISEPLLGWRLIVFVGLGGYLFYESRRAELLPTMFNEKAGRGAGIICFAGAAWSSDNWTNRQQIMSRVAKKYPVLYVEPRVWIFRYLWHNRREINKIVKFIKRVIWYEKEIGGQLWVKSQWNLLPGSREYKVIAKLNHWLNKSNVLLAARALGLKIGQAKPGVVVWLYDTEAAQYLPAFKKSLVVYDCVDDHAAQAGVDRNPARVEEEEQVILKRADLVTVTSKRLFELKKRYNNNVQLVLNAGDVSLYTLAFAKASADKPVFGSVGALDSYKYDFDLLYKLAQNRPEWEFRLIGRPVVERGRSDEVEGVSLDELEQLPNVTLLGHKNRKEVPRYVRQFDVCLIPYRNNRYNAASWPLKFWEFMATGKPVIVSGLPELKQYDGLIGYGQSVDEFEQLCEAALKNPEQGSDERQKMAKQHGWQQRTDRLLELVDRLREG